MKTPVKAAIIVLAVIIFAAAGGTVFITASYPKAAEYAQLTAPRITEKPDSRSLQAAFDGDPEAVISDAFSRLFKAYYSCKGVKKGPGQPAPIARYEGLTGSEESADTDSATSASTVWKGFTAIPIPEDAEAPQNPGEGVSVQTLTYGTVGEIVHFGPYENEFETIRTLTAYIAAEGYEICGLHEEEYIKGPGMPFVGPKNYITVIRYRVRKTTK